MVDASVSKTDEVMLVPVRSRPWVQIRLNRKLLITNACDFFFLFFSPFVKTHDEQIGQTTMSSLRHVPDFLLADWLSIVLEDQTETNAVIYLKTLQRVFRARSIDIFCCCELITRKSFIVTKQVCAYLEDGRRSKMPT